MDIKQIEHFRMVGRLEHVTKAALALNVPQPALSRSLARLQKELGVALFEQSGRSVRLTEAGSAFLVRSERLLRELQNAQRELDGIARGDSATVTLGFLRSMALRYVPQLVHDFCRTQPTARFVFRQIRGNEWEDQLSAGELDVCLAGAPQHRTEINWQRTFRQELWLSVPSGHRLSGRRSVRIRELAKQTFVSYHRGHGTRDMVDELCRGAGFAPTYAYEGEDATCLLAFVEAGFGISILPRNPAWPGVSEVRLADTTAHRDLGLAWRADQYRPPIVEAFRRFALAHRAP